MAGKNSILLKKYFPEIYETYDEIFQQLHDLYIDWNTKINIVSRKDTENLFLHHILHSLAFLHFSSLNKGLNVLDVGTGGGFPGIPLSIVFPENEFTLVDGRNKKIFVVNEIIKSLNLHNVIGVHSRSEDISGKFDVIIGRAITDFKDFVKMVKPNLKPQGVIYYWTGGTYKSYHNLSGTTIFKLEDFFEEKHFEDKFILKYL